ncbi:P-loop containing nucleoside triphosphate hydrolase protein [Sordaria sp. MPI-SDFR-AT-0083]|nr:P-loop containing nucleoside triphosphate hydrolase protein [Sordaria sp. MPI-SDFR-AT-0083]
MLDPNQKAVVIGISGCSSSGKTTLARLLRDIFPNTFILHEDDFYKPEAEIPMKDGLTNWDCPEALNIPDMTSALEHIRATGELPATFDSKEDINSIGPCPITTDFINTIKCRVADWLQPSSPGHQILKSPQKPLKICILDGFLLYSPPPLLPATLLSQMDIKLFLLVSKAKALQRREARDGYVTLEGFWKDPPGYVDKIVWPEYVRAHEWMFEDGDVEKARLRGDVRERLGVLVNSKKEGEETKMDRDFGETLEWAVESIMRELERLVLGKEEEDGQKEGEKEREDEKEKKREKEAIALNSFAMKKKWAAGQRERNARELLIKKAEEQQQQQK